jgi:hypothetical protein
MGMPILRSARPRTDSSGQAVAFQNIDPFKAVRQHASDREPADACTNHYRALSQ